MKKRPGIKIKDIVLGTGEEATREKNVVVHVRMYLNRGTELPCRPAGGLRTIINLARRDKIPGLRYGIEGMRIGGQRTITISPHLAYGSDGLPGFIPANAVIRCEVELLDIRKEGVIYPEDYPPGKFLLVFHPGEAGRNLPRWQFGLYEDGRCGATITEPIEGLAWRYARFLRTDAQLGAEKSKTILEEALALPKNFAAECIKSDDLWADIKERGNSITRDKHTNTLCLSIRIMVQGQLLCEYSVRENSQPLMESKMYHSIKEIIDSNPREPLFVRK